MALTLRNYVIGFIHLNTLGAITALMFAHAVMRGWFNERLLLVRVAIGLFISGFALSELLLFLQGTLFWAGLGMMPGYYTVLLGFSMLLPIGVGSLLVHMLAMWPRSTSHDE